MDNFLSLSKKELNLICNEILKRKEILNSSDFFLENTLEDAFNFAVKSPLDLNFIQFPFLKKLLIELIPFELVLNRALLVSPKKVKVIKIRRNSWKINAKEILKKILSLDFIKVSKFDLENKKEIELEIQNEGKIKLKAGDGTFSSNSRKNEKAIKEEDLEKISIKEFFNHYSNYSRGGYSGEILMFKSFQFIIHNNSIMEEFKNNIYVKILQEILTLYDIKVEDLKSVELSGNYFAIRKIYFDQDFNIHISPQTPEGISDLILHTKNGKKVFISLKDTKKSGGFFLINIGAKIKEIFTKSDAKTLNHFFLKIGLNPKKAVSFFTSKNLLIDNNLENYHDVKENINQIKNFIYNIVQGAYRNTGRYLLIEKTGNQFKIKDLKPENNGFIPKLTDLSSIKIENFFYPSEKRIAIAIQGKIKILNSNYKFRLSIRNKSGGLIPNVLDLALREI